MKPVEFLGHNIVFGKDQPEYQPLPALIIPGEEGQVISCWEFSDEEIEAIVKSKRMYISQYTFNGRLQPILPMAELGDQISFI